MKTNISVALMWLAFGVVLNPAACKTNDQSNNAKPKTNQSKNQNSTPLLTSAPVDYKEGNASGEMKILAEGFYSNIEKPFVAVVRDVETYRALRSEFVNVLPEMSEGFFKTRAIIAAFLGTRRSGGYSVSIINDRNGIIRVAETTPPKDALTTMALTSPFKVVSIAISEQTLLRLESGEVWKGELFDVKDSEFVSSGGIAGRSEKFGLQGRLRVMQLGKLLTIAFDLKSTGDAKPRTLQTHATAGIVNNGITLSRLDAGSLIDSPNSGLRVTGQLNDKTISLFFEPLPSRIADGYSGSGKLTANSSVQVIP